MAELKIGVRLDAIPGAVTASGMPSAASLRTALRRAREIGASTVELCGRRLVPIDQLSDTGVRSLRKMLDDLNLRVAAIRFQTTHGYDRLPDLDRRVDATKLAMRAAYKLGCPLVINQIGMVPPPPPKPAPSVRRTTASGIVLATNTSDPGSDVSGVAASNFTIAKSSNPAADPRWDTMRSVLEDLGGYGARTGAFLAAETGTESGEHLAALIDSIEESYIAVALNPGQLIVNRHDPLLAIQSLSRYIQYVAAVDGVLDLAAGRGLMVPLGQGTADFPNLIGKLEDIPYRGSFVLGRPSMSPATAIEELSQGASYLRHL